MATSYDKVVKLACKPKAAPPKAKYLDPIIAATWSEDGAVHDVCKALSPRLREPNAIIVFKALLVLHTMIRNGATDNVLSYLSQSDVLRLKNISAAHWEGYNAPQNLQQYALYLDTRIRAYRDLKHDAIRVQSETNRDMRNSAAVEEQLLNDRDHDRDTQKRRRFGRNRQSDETRDSLSTMGGSNSGPQRSKTIAGRKLRIMTVEKGLLRETKIVQKMIDSLVECRFYLDDLEDELNITALRMLVKDLLILFQACNEGVINVLEHYFEMSKYDAKDALAIYRHFCQETERVVEYLGVAKKLQNLLNVPIPNLRHAPVSLAGALEEYLNDPNFEQNRIEYKTNKEAAEKNARNGVKTVAKPVDKPSESTAPESQASAASSSVAKPPEDKPPSSQAMIDFFAAIEGEQQTMFNPQTNSPTTNYFQQQAASNPFQQQMQMQQQMYTGAPFGVQQMQQPIQGQPTGFIMPQQTAMNPFGQQPQNPYAQPQAAFGQQQQQQQSFSSAMMQPQPTGFLAPQATGANPFRQSTLFPQTTGMPTTGMSTQGAYGQPQIPTAGTTGTNPFPTSTFGSTQPSFGTNSFPSSGQIQPQATATANPFPNFGSSAQPNFATSSNPFPSFSSSATLSPPSSNPNPSTPMRSASVPPSSVTEQPQAVKTHQTGSRNPFGAPVMPPPPVPKVPTLMELAMGYGSSNNQQPAQSSQQTNGVATNPTGAASGSLMSNLASSFSTGAASNGTSSTFNPSTSTSLFGTSTGSTSPTTTSSMFSSSLSSQPTGATTTSSFSSSLQPQTTGFSGIKAFKPSSSFGAALLESLPPIPQSAPTTPDASKHNPTGSLGSATALGTGFSSGGVAGNTVGTGLRPQATGMAGVANPFRSTMFSMSPGPPAGGPGGLNAAPTGGAFSSGLSPSATGMPGQFNSNFLGNSAFGMGNSAPGASNAQPQQQHNGQTSLI